MAAAKVFSFEPMLCQSVGCLPESRDWQYELKLDGFLRGVANRDAVPSSGRATTRISPADFQGC